MDSESLIVHSNEPEATPLFAKIWQSRGVLFAVAGVTVAAGIAYTLWVPPVWEAKATLMFPVRSTPFPGMGAMSESGGLASSLMGGPTPLKVFQGMLKSERTLEHIVKNTGLDRRDLKDMRDLIEQAQENTLTISVRDKDSELAKKIVQLHIDSLRLINEDISAPVFADDTAVLAKRVKVQKDKVRQSEARLLAFQNSAVTAPSVAPTGAGKEATMIGMPGRWGEQLKQLEIEHRRLESSLKAAEASAKKAAGSKGSLPSQLPPVIKWRERLTELEYDLQLKQLTLADEAPEIVKLKKSIDITREKMEAEIGKYMASLDQQMIEGANGISLPALLTQKVGLEAQIAATRQLAELAPGESIELSRLMRDLATQSTILQQLQAQYEMASVQADRDPNKWEVLDSPRVDDRPVNKSLLRSGAASLFAGLFIGSFFAVRRTNKTRAPQDEELEVKAAA